MFIFKSALVFSALALSVVRAQQLLALSWNSTSPYGQSKGLFNLVDSPYGYAMVFADGSASDSTLSAHYDFAQGTVVQDCPHKGLQIALIPVEGSAPEAYTVNWVEPSATLPEGSFTKSLQAGDGAFVSTVSADA